MAFAFTPDVCSGHFVQAEALQPPALIQSAPGLMGGAVTTTLLANQDRLPDGSSLRLTPHPELQVQRIQLAPGERVPAPQGLVLRQVLVEQGQLKVEPRGAGRPHWLEAGQWSVDDGAHALSAGDAQPVNLLVVQHFRRNAELTGRMDRPARSGVARANDAAPGGPSLPAPREGASAPGGPPLLREPVAQPDAAPPLRFTSDYTGQPITMPDGPLRVLINRYVIQGHAELPWHLHPNQRYAFVESGQLQVEDQSGNRRVYGPGEVLVEQQQVVHRGINLGQAPVSLLVFDYIPRYADSNTQLYSPP